MPSDAESLAPAEHRFELRLLLGTGLLLWLVAALACVWELLALQPPDTPLHVGVLAGPVAQLRGFGFGLGTSCLVAALWWPRLFRGGTGRVLALTWVTGALLHTGALTYAAARGLLAVQLFDPRADARYTLYVRAFAHALTLLSLLGLGVRALRKRSRA